MRSTTLPTDPVAILADPVAAVRAMEALDPEAITERLDTIERERTALHMLLRTARAARRRKGATNAR